jgi:iron complex outermembrane receptor protein
LNALGRYVRDFPIGTLAFQVDGVVYGDQYLEVTNSEVSFEESYSIWNASIAYTSPDSAWSVALWAKNVGDEAYRLYDFDLGALGTIAYYGPPRRFGMTASYRF